MNLDQFFDSVAPLLSGVSASDLKAYAREDTTIGGYHPDPSLRQWESGSVWAVEGQALYALVRALQPDGVIEYGSMYGCSATHILTALAKNGHGILYAVDNAAYSRFEPPEHLAPYLSMSFTTYQEFIRDHLPGITPDIIFEDMLHSADQVAEVWSTGSKALRAGGLLISHDAAHFLVGEQIKEGIQQAGIYDAAVYLIEPADCGFGLWVKPSKPTVVKEAARIGEVNYPLLTTDERESEDLYETVKFAGHPLIEEDLLGDHDPYNPDVGILDALGNMTVAELREYASENDIDLSGVTRKADIIDAILEAE